MSMEILKVGDRVEWTGLREPGESHRGRVVSILGNNAYVHTGDGMWVGTVSLVDGGIPESSGWKVNK